MEKIHDNQILLLEYIDVIYPVHTLIYKTVIIKKLWSCRGDHIKNDCSSSARGIQWFDLVL